MSFHSTPSQTVGPFFSIGCDRMKKSDLAGEGVAGERIEVTGRVIDGDAKLARGAAMIGINFRRHGSQKRSMFRR